MLFHMSISKIGKPNAIGFIIDQAIFINRNTKTSNTRHIILRISDIRNRT